MATLDPHTTLPAPPPEGGPRRAVEEVDAKAVVAFVLGLLCVIGTFFGVGLLLGAPAIALGALAYRDIRRAEGLLLGRGLASAGMALGIVGCTLFFVWAGAVLFFVLDAGPIEASRAPPLVMPSPTWSRSGSETSDEGPRSGTLELHRAEGPLRQQLARQALAAHAVGQAVLVETTAEDCGACEEVAHAMLDPRTRAALSQVRVVDIDVGEFQSELGRLRMDEATAPWFYLLDSRGEPKDAISADEWDENDAAEIAPVLGAFVEGRLHPRHHGWNGGTTL
ncbi:MAG: DUF4190 domain-containing protein [Polyangiaceae bacterium]|jgi:hypothetical protein